MNRSVTALKFRNCCFWLENPAKETEPFYGRFGLSCVLSCNYFHSTLSLWLWFWVNIWNNQKISWWAGTQYLEEAIGQVPKSNFLSPVGIMEHPNCQGLLEYMGPGSRCYRYHVMPRKANLPKATVGIPTEIISALLYFCFLWHLRFGLRITAFSKKASFVIVLLVIMKACPSVLCLEFSSLIIMTPLVSLISFAGIVSVP